MQPWLALALRALLNATNMTIKDRVAVGVLPKGLLRSHVLGCRG
jgi:hypothetical protein